MANKSNKNYPKLKTFFILISGCLLTTLMIIISKYINSQKAKENLYKEKSLLFNEIISNRKLDGEGEEANNKNKMGSDKVCERGSEDLVKYYQTGDLGDINLKNDSIKSEERGKAYFDALINIVKQITGSEEEDINESEKEELRYLDISFSDSKNDIITYIKHLIPFFIFLVIGILCIPGWIICCICTCCNCCCCCCCIKSSCKIPCFLFTFLFYALSVIICIYSLTQSNKIFVGIANTECSILKFLDEVLEGEMKQELPRWAGIKDINDILQDIIDQTKQLRNGAKQNLDLQVENIGLKKGEFIELMKNSGNKFFDNGKYITDYSNVGNEYNFNFENGYNIAGNFVLDIVRMFGKYNEGVNKYLPEQSILDLWESEYIIVSTNADNYLSTAQNSFSNIIDGSSGDILENLEKGKAALNETEDSFNDIQSKIASFIIDYSETIDKNGKLVFKLVFSILVLMNIALAVLMLLISFFSGKVCIKCSFCRCILKFFTHLLWNILALLMIIIFIVGFLFSFIGQVGNDAMSVISFIVSEENLGKDGVGGERILVNQLGDSIKYIDRCINGNGKLEEELDINTAQIDSINQLKQIEQQINETKEEFIERKRFETFNYCKRELEKRVNLNNLTLIEENSDFTTRDKTKLLDFNILLEAMNNAIKNDNSITVDESWKINGGSNYICVENNDNSDNDDSIPTGTIVLNPKNCKPFYRDWIYKLETTTNPEYVYIKGRAKILTDAINYIENANQDVGERSFKKIITDLKDKYNEYLEKYITALDDCGKIISKITGKLRKYINDDDGVFAFVKCNFIGTNLKIILKYLKSALGGNIKTIGILLFVIGCSLALSISSTILLIIINNRFINENLEKIQNNKIPDYPLSSENRIKMFE